MWSYKYIFGVNHVIIYLRPINLRISSKNTLSLLLSSKANDSSLLVKTLTSFDMCGVWCMLYDVLFAKLPRRPPFKKLFLA